MATHKSLVAVLTLTSFLILTIECATFENVNVTLTTRYTPLYVNNTAPVKVLHIKADDRLSKYVVEQPLKDVTIENQNVPVLGESSVANLPNIEQIRIVRSGVKEIEPGAFWNLPNLESLEINENEIEEIRNGVFNDLNLTVEFQINLANNKISKIGSKAFNNIGIGWFGRIILDNNRISTWNSDWFTGTRLRAISIAHNLLEEIPPNSLGYFLQFKESQRKLEFWYLVASDNRIKKVHIDAFKGIETLGYLNLKNNSIEHLEPGVFNDVLDINNLVLTNNNLSNIDEDLFKNTELTYVSLQDNNLECVFPNITKLYTVYLAGNPVTSECIHIWNKWMEEHDNKTLIDLAKPKYTSD